MPPLGTTNESLRTSQMRYMRLCPGVGEPLWEWSRPIPKEYKHPQPVPASVPAVCPADGTAHLREGSPILLHFWRAPLGVSLSSSFEGHAGSVPCVRSDPLQRVGPRSGLLHRSHHAPRDAFAQRTVFSSATLESPPLRGVITRSVMTTVKEQGRCAARPAVRTRQDNGEAGHDEPGWSVRVRRFAAVRRDPLKRVTTNTNCPRAERSSGLAFRADPTTGGPTARRFAQAPARSPGRVPRDVSNFLAPRSARQFR